MVRKLLSEFIGTFAIVFFGTGAIIVNEQTKGGVSHFSISLTFGLVVTIMIFLFREISGAHFNPAVTIAIASTKRLSIADSFFFILSQISGGLIASLVLRILFPGSITLGGTTPNGSIMQSFILEFILTFLLMAVILISGGDTKNKSISPILIGLIIFIEALIGGPISGASMNPARSIAPAIITGNLASLWVYIVAPISGALIASGIESVLMKEGDNLLSSNSFEQTS